MAGSVGVDANRYFGCLALNQISQSDIDDYLANLSIGFEESRRFLDLFKRESACDDGFQLPRKRARW